MTQPIGPSLVPTEWLPRLASLVHTIRPDWHEPGIRAALTPIADRPLIDVAAAAIAACRRLDQRTPALIPTDGPHWPKPTESQRTYTESCIVTYCEHGDPGATCRTCHPPREHAGVAPTPEQRAAMRAAITQARTNTQEKP